MKFKCLIYQSEFLFFLRKLEPLHWVCVSNFPQSSASESPETRAEGHSPFATPHTFHFFCVFYLPGFCTHVFVTFEQKILFPKSNGNKELLKLVKGNFRRVVS